MSNKTRSILKGVAVLLVLLALCMHMNWVVIPALARYEFWLMMLGFGFLMIGSK